MHAQRPLWVQWGHLGSPRVQWGHSDLPKAHHPTLEEGHGEALDLWVGASLGCQELPGAETGAAGSTRLHVT